MNKTETYRQTLRSLKDWVPFLKKNSGLPGPRGNLELAYTVADIGTQEQFEHFLHFNGDENTPEMFVLFSIHLYCAIAHRYEDWFFHRS